MRGERANAFILAGVFALTFVLLYGGASVLSAYVPWRVPMMLALDERLPLVPGAALVYLTIGPMLLGCAKPAHIITPSATVRRIVNMTALTVADAQQEPARAGTA